MLTDNSIEDFVTHRRAFGASEETCRAYRQDLLAVLPDFNDLRASSTMPIDWAETEFLFANYLTTHRAELAARTIRRRMAAFRAWARWRGNRELLRDYKPPTPAAPEPHPIPEGIDGVIRMICSTRNPRHKALCALTGLMGLRIDEAVRVRPEDFDFTDPNAPTLVVNGKGSKTRIVPVSATAWAHLRRAHQRAIDEGTSLVRLTNSGARKAITRHARNAGLSRHVKSHDMRATFGTAAYEKSKDLRAVQELLGHADAKTTQVYTGVSTATKRAAAEVA